MACLAGSGYVNGQETVDYDSVLIRLQSLQASDNIERLIETNETVEDISSVLEELPALEKPVNLNSAGEIELNQIPLLSHGQRKELLNYLVTYGEILSIYELLSIPGFDSALVTEIRPFISIGPVLSIPRPTPKNLLKYGHHDMVVRYEQSFPTAEGYLTNDSLHLVNPGLFYSGTPQKYYFRYTYSWFDKIKIGLSGEKDPGEQFFSGAQSAGMDFYAGYFSLNNLGILRNLTLGNFRVSFGQSLTIGSGQSLTASPGFSGTVSGSNGIRPSTGTNESSGLRGIAATIKAKPFDASGFISYNRRDANLVRNDSERYVTAFNSSGYHRTVSELAHRNSIGELVCGANVSLTVAPGQQFGFRTGITGLYCHYSAMLRPAVHPYSRYNFQGSDNIITGLDFQVRYRGLHIFGEAGRSMNGGFGWIAGATYSPDPRVTINMICRNYGADYQNPFSNAFGQSSINANEKGLFTSANVSIGSRLVISGYLDLFTFPWLRYRTDASTSGSEAGLMINWQVGRNALINLKFCQKQNNANDETIHNNTMHRLTCYLTRTYRFAMEVQASEKVMLKTRFEVREAATGSHPGSIGYFICQDAHIKLAKFLKTATLRFALFDIPGYDTRIYVYEPDVRFTFSVPVYQGRGMRTCLMLNVRLLKSVELWLRGGLTKYDDRQEVGSGLDVTKGNIRGELTGQVFIRL